MDEYIKRDMAIAMALYVHGGNYCPNCGAKMDGGSDHG